MLDCHVHIMNNDEPDPEALALALSKADVTGAIIISPPPASFTHLPAGPNDAENRLSCLMNWCQNRIDWFPFFWIDPLESNVDDQIEAAVLSGVAGFKIILTQVGPEHPQIERAAGLIAQTGRPILFHSGILFDGHDSSRFNRPAGFEALLRIPRLRFALAHASWPWIDECLAVYGKFCDARKKNPARCSELFLDLTPGTPKLYRDELFRKLFGIGYALTDHILFGTDNSAMPYDFSGTRQKLSTDRQLLNQYWTADDPTGCQSAEEAWHALSELNLRRFIQHEN